MIVMARYGDDELAFALMAAGAYVYLPKPFTASELILTLRKAEYREAQRSAEKPRHRRFLRCATKELS